MPHLSKFILVVSIITLITGCSSKPATNPEPQNLVSPIQSPEISKVAVTPTDNISIAMDIVKKLQENQYTQVTTFFDSTMEKALPPQELENTWKTIQTQAGVMQKTLIPRTETMGPYDIVYIPCQFENTLLDIKIVFNNNHTVGGFFIVPSQTVTESPKPNYIQPAAFDEQTVVFGNSEWRLPGTLTIPKGPGSFSILILVHGSGPNDRDESLGSNKPFKDLAEGLGSKGIASLRYDKRTKVYAVEMAAIQDKITVKEEVLDDVSEAVKFLQSQPKINPKKIFILGHSLGGMLVPRIAKSNPEVAGYIIMAGTTRPLEDVILEQMKYIYSLQPSIGKTEQEQMAKIEEQVKQVKDPNLSDKTPKEILPFGSPAKYWLDLRGYNPPEIAKAITQPIFILQGQRDYQVTLADYENWRNALSSKPNVEFKLYPKLNHLFIEGENKSTPQEYQIPGHIAGYVINDIAGWVKKQGM